MTDTKPLIFYDISSPIEPRSYAPNPSKARLALGLKGVSFKTTYVDLPDIVSVRKGLGVPAVRKYDDGSDFYTLPMLQEQSSGKTIGDSFDIANYLEDTFPDSGGRLFPQDSTGTGLDYESPNKDAVFAAPLTDLTGAKNEAYARFNVHVDTTFSAHAVLIAQYMPFNPKTADATKARMAKRAHLKSWDDVCIQGEVRENIREAFKKALESLAKLYTVHDNGPYLEGELANYCDVIVGGWLNMFFQCLPEEEWKDFRTWHGGVFARLHDALQENYFVLN